MRENVMTHGDSQNCNRASLSRRGTIGALTVGAAALAAGARAATPDMGPVAPPSTVTTPPRDFSPNGAPTTYFMDPDIITIDPSFDALLAPTNGLKRLWTGGIWLEGPAWSAQGRYLVFSDIPNNRQLRWLEDDGRVGVFRTPSNHSNGNTFDF
jgi:gluconolactonase